MIIRHFTIDPNAQNGFFCAQFLLFALDQKHQRGKSPSRLLNYYLKTFLLLLLTIPQLGHARILPPGILGKCHPILRKLFHQPLALGTTLVTQGGKKLSIGQIIDYGTNGDIYLVEGTKLIVKVPQHFTGLFPLNARTQSAIQDELNVYYKIHPILKEINTVVSIPIVDIAQNGAFVGLVKPHIDSSKSLSSLIKSGEGLDVYKLKRLQDFYDDVSQIVYRLRDSMPYFFPDLGLQNIVWVESPDDMESVGLKEPGWLLVELTSLNTIRDSSRKLMAQALPYYLEIDPSRPQ